MTFKGVTRMTGDIMPMLDGVLIAANGHFFKVIAYMLIEHKTWIAVKK